MHIDFNAHTYSIALSKACTVNIFVTGLSNLHLAYVFLPIVMSLMCFGVLLASSTLFFLCVTPFLGVVFCFPEISESHTYTKANSNNVISVTFAASKKAQSLLSKLASLQVNYEKKVYFFKKMRQGMSVGTRKVGIKEAHFLCLTPFFCKNESAKENVQRVSDLFITVI